MSAAIDALRAPSVRHLFQRTAQRIASQAQALQVAHALAQEFARGAAERDRERRLPFEEIERFSHSGLWAIAVPRAYGGIGASWATVAEVFKIVSAADPSIGQIPQNHFGNLNVIANAGSEEQKRFFFGEALNGARFGNAGPERNSKNVLDVRTRAVLDDEAGDGSYLLTGTRFYSTGALYAHWIPSRAIDDQGDPLFVYNRFDAPGLRVVDDWSSFGQRTTASGSVVFDRVRVPASQVLQVKDFLKQPNNIGPVSQLIQAAIDAGIAHAAVRDAIEFVTTRSRPYADSGVERAGDDPYIIRDIGNLKLRLHASDALLERAAGVRTPCLTPSASTRWPKPRLPWQKPRCSPPSCRCWRPKSCSNWPARPPRWPPTISTATGATRACIRCTIRCAGNITRSATTP